MISVGVRLAAFNLKQIANLTCTDELDLYSIGEKKVALFCCIPDADTSMNYLVGMIYSNLFQTEDGGASPYDYAKTPLAHDDLKIDINRLDDYELLSTEDILGE